MTVPRSDPVTPPAAAILVTTVVSPLLTMISRAAAPISSTNGDNSSAFARRESRIGLLMARVTAVPPTGGGLFRLSARLHIVRAIFAGVRQRIAVTRRMPRPGGFPRL